MRPIASHFTLRWFTTPKELLDLAQQMADFWIDNDVPGRDLLVTQFTGKNETLEIVIDQERIRKEVI